MFDKERIAHIMGDIEKYFTDLREMEIKEADDLEDKKNFYSVSMILFSILNRTIDLGEEIVAGKKLGIPSTYKEIFKLLLRDKVIDRNMEKELSELVFYRNLLSHEYHDLSIDDVFDVYKRIEIVKKFVESAILIIKEK